MSDSAADQLSRILHLIPRLADGEAHNLEKVAREVGTDRQTVLRDIQSLSERIDEPGAFVEGLQIFLDARGTVAVLPNLFLRPMRLTRGELCALELGLAMLRAERPAEEHAAIDGARSRLQAAISRLPDDDELGDHRTASLAAPGNVERLRDLREAHQTGRKVRLTYRKAADETASRRVVCPYAIVFSSGHWYAVAHCESSDGVRFFRLDRVEEVELLEARYAQPPTFSVDEVMPQGKAFQTDGASVLRLRYSPAVARWIAEREGKTLADDGSLEIEHPLADPEWAVRHVLQYGPDVTVLEPQSVRDDIVRRLQAMLTT